MFLATQTKLQQATGDFARRRYGLEVNVIINQPPRPAMGDFALPLAMELGRKAGKPPRQIADELAIELRSVEGIARAEVAGPGYVNVYLARAAYAAGVETREHEIGNREQGIERRQ